MRYLAMETLAEHPYFRAVGEGIGLTTLASSAACLITSYITAMYAQELVNKGIDGNFTLASRDRNMVVILVCSAIIAPFGAMIIEHVYMIIGARAAVYLHIPHDVRLPRLFYLLLVSYWASFALAQALFVVALKDFQHGKQSSNMFIYSCLLMPVVMLLTIPLHVIATRFRNRLSNIARINRLSQSEVQMTELEDLEECSIYLDKPSAGDIIRRLPCQHTFHRMCVDRWLVKNPRCPYCIQPI